MFDQSVKTLESLHPSWVIDIAPTRTGHLLRIFVYSDPYCFKNIVDIRELSFPRIEGNRVFISPVAWIAHQIKTELQTATRPKTQAKSGIIYN